MLKSWLLAPQNAALFGKQDLCRSSQLTTSPSGWALVHVSNTLTKKGPWDTVANTQRDDEVKSHRDMKAKAEIGTAPPRRKECLRPPEARQRQ